MTTAAPTRSRRAPSLVIFVAIAVCALIAWRVGVAGVPSAADGQRAERAAFEERYEETRAEAQQPAYDAAWAESYARTTGT